MTKIKGHILRIIAGGLLLVHIVGSFMLTEPDTLLSAVLEGNFRGIMQLLSLLAYIILIVCLWIPLARSKRWVKGMIIGTAAFSVILRICVFLNNWYMMSYVYNISDSDRQSALLIEAFSYYGLVPHLFMMTVLLALTLQTRNQE